MNSLTRESDNCFREHPQPGQERGSAYYRFHERLRLLVGSPRRTASNLSDASLDLLTFNKYKMAYNEALRKGRELPSPPPPITGRDPERVRLRISGKATTHYLHHRFATISKFGISGYIDEIQVEIEHLGGDDTGSIYEFDDGEMGQKVISIVLYPSNSRFEWLWEQLGDRPNSQLALEIDFKAFQHEADHFLYEPPQRKTFCLEADSVTHIEGVGFHVTDAVGTD